MTSNISRAMFICVIENISFSLIAWILVFRIFYQKVLRTRLNNYTIIFWGEMLPINFLNHLRKSVLRDSLLGVSTRENYQRWEEVFFNNVLHSSLLFRMYQPKLFHLGSKISFYIFFKLQIHSIYIVVPG